MSRSEPRRRRVDGQPLVQRPRPLVSWETKVNLAAAARVYFVTAVVDGEGGRCVKIGTVSLPDLIIQRLRTIQAHSPIRLELLATIQGGRGVERDWHDRFRRLRSHYEWFRLDPELLEAILTARGAFVPFEARDVFARYQLIARDLPYPRRCVPTRSEADAKNAGAVGAIRDVLRRFRASSRADGVTEPRTEKE